MGLTATIEEIPKEWMVPDPVLPLPSRAQFMATAGSADGLARLEDVLRNRAAALERRRNDPLRYGYEPDCWGDFRRLVADGFDEIFVSGANREGKTTLLDKFIVQDLFGRKCEWALFHNTEATSIHQQQKTIFKFFPEELRHRLMVKPIKRHARFGAHAAPQHSVYLSYNEATGFTSANFILPDNGSHAYFFNYGQSSTVWEGPEYDGMLFEEAVTLEVLETSRFRRGKDRRLLLLVNFTPKWGFTPVVQNMIAGARIVETRPAALLDANTVHVKGCPPGHMPYIMHGARPKSAIIFFHNGMNPLGAGHEIMTQLIGAPKARVMIRAYGWADKGENAAFPKFGPAHILTRTQWEKVRQGKGTWYLVSDPGSAGKNWFFQWWFATAEGWHIMAKEWPDAARYEEWAVSPGQTDATADESGGRRHDWRRGPAQRLEAGRSIASYKSLLLTEEGWRYEGGKWVQGEKGIAVYRRLMDPAFGGTEVPTAEEGATPIELMGQKDQKDSEGRSVPAMEWEQASRGKGGAGTGGFKADRSQLLADWMDWDESKPLTPENCPRLYVVEDCMQSITAFREYVTPPWSTSKNALCEPIDAAGYYAKSECRYVDAAKIKLKAGGWW